MTPEALTTHLAEFIAAVPNIKRVWVAYSGGLDSTVLLHALIPLQGRWPIGVIHANHQLAVDAGQWQRHCVEHARLWGFAPVIAETVAVASSGSGLEQAARAARYQLFEGVLQQQDLLLMAHHRQDQAETFMLRLARGAGVQGLTAMTGLRSLGKGQLGRPLLSIAKSSLQAYAQSQQLRWIEDPSNLSSQFDRNFLRKDILPVLRQRWSQWDEQVVKAAASLRDSQDLLDTYLADDFTNLKLRPEKIGSSLEFKPLLNISTIKRNGLMRYWLMQQGYKMPSQVQLGELHRVLVAKLDATPLLLWSNCEIRRYQNRLYCLPRSAVANSKLVRSNLQNILAGNDVEQQIKLTLNHAVPGFRLSGQDELVSLYSVGVSRGHPSLRPHSQSLKKLLQEYRVAPWLRPIWPAIVRSEQLVCLPDLWVEKSFWTDDNLAVNISWQWQERPLPGNY